MAKKKNKKTKRRIMILGTLSLIAIFSFIFNSCYYSYKIAVLEKSKSELEEQLTTLKEKEKTLTTDIQKLKDPEYIAKYARENYMYSKDGEYIIKIEEDEKEKKEQQEQVDYRYLLIAASTGLVLVIIYILKRKKSDK